MKRFNLAILAVVLAVGSAFTFKPVTYTFRFDGTSTNAADRTDESKYTLATPSCNGNETILCSIDAEKDVNDDPVISGALQTALYNGNSSVPNFSATGVIGKTP